MQTLKEYLLQQTGCTSFEELKKKLYKKRRDTGYDCYYSQIKGKGFKAFYTSNDNHFCEYGFTFTGIGMCSTLGIDADSITKAGRERGVASHYVNEKMLQTIME